MKWFLVAAAVLMSPFTAFAYELGGSLGGQFGNNQVAGGPVIGAVLSTDLSPNLNLDFKLNQSFLKGKGDKIVDDTSIGITSLEIAPRLKTTIGSLTPYVTAGIGLFLIGDSLPDEFDAAPILLGIEVDQDIHSTLGGIFGAGVEGKFFGSDVVSWGVDLSYVYLNPKVDLRITDLNTNETLEASDHVQLSSARVQVGLKYRF